MDKQKAKILVLVEGSRRETALMNHLLAIYGINERHQIVSYNTNIHVLYNSMFKDEDPYTLDLLQVLKEREKDEIKKSVFDERYSDVLLIFDLDPQDDLYLENKIQQMLEFFCESSENGKLYINYPSAESFYHMRTIPDPLYNSYTVTLNELKEKTYKTRVNAESRDHDFRKFAQTKKECDEVILQNVSKALLITGQSATNVIFPPPDIEILHKQSIKMQTEGCLYVLCTCGFYIIDYNSNLINADNSQIEIRIDSGDDM